MNEQPQVQAKPTPAVCPCCGFTQADFAKTGKLGCARCYETFEYPLSTILPHMHPALIHRGKRPWRWPGRNELESEITALETLLNEAIAEEAFERAAEHRDRLQALRDRLDPNTPYGIG